MTTTAGFLWNIPWFLFASRTPSLCTNLITFTYLKALLIHVSTNQQPLTILPSPRCKQPALCQWNRQQHSSPCAGQPVTGASELQQCCNGAEPKLSTNQQHNRQFNYSSSCQLLCTANLQYCGSNNKSISFSSYSTWHKLVSY